MPRLLDSLSIERDLMRRNRSRCVSIVSWAVIAVFLGTGVLLAGESTTQEPPPLPLHTIEGVGGRVLTPSAKLTNPPAEGDLVRKPPGSLPCAMIGHEDLQVLAISETIGRLELSYALNRFSLDDFDRDVRNTLGVDLTDNEIYLHHLNARVNLLRENACGLDWMPAITAGAHYKYNHDIDKINRDLGHALELFDYERNEGFDFTLTGTKTITALPRPVIVSLGARLSKAAQFGLLGFSDDHLLTFEGNIGTLITDRIVLGAEYRQKGEALAEIGDLVQDEDSWWDVHAAYILNNNAEFYAVAGDAGAVLNHSDEFFFGVVFKQEF